MNDDILKKYIDKLQDVGKRNNLVNLNCSSSTICEILYPSYTDIFSSISHDKKFEIYNPKNDINRDFIDEASNDENDDLDNKAKYLNLYQNRLKKKNEILVYNEKHKTLTALKNINRKAKTILEESGINVTFLTIGLIKWNEDENSTIYYNAPLLLVPIKIEYSSEIEPVLIKISEDELITNPTFNNKLKIEHNFVLPDFNDDKIEEYFDKIQEMVEIYGWTLERECKIGIFSFAKINMYYDLLDNIEQVKNNNIIKSIFGDETNDSNTLNMTTNYKIESNITSFHNIVDADSSQEEAIKLAKSGKSFIVEGPPGTGKSQTITNIIAECLHDGKKVLFVSEKAAALNVVYNKISQNGLGDYCLELHSHNANKKDVISNLCKTLEKERVKLSDSAKNDIRELQKYEQKLNAYYDELYLKRDIINKSLFNLYDNASNFNDAKRISFQINDICHKDENFLNEVDNLLEQYRKYSEQIGNDYHNYCWFGYRPFNEKQSDLYKLEEDLKDCLALIKKLDDLKYTIKEKCKLEYNTLDDCLNVQKLLNIIKDSKYIIPPLFVKNNLEETIETFKEMRTIAKGVLTKKDEISNNFDDSIYDINELDYYNKLVINYNNIFKRLFSKNYKKLCYELTTYKTNRKKIKYNEALAACSLLKKIKEETNNFNKLESKILKLIGSGYNSLNSNFDEIVNELEIIKQVVYSNLDLKQLKLISNENFETMKDDFDNYSSLINSEMETHKESLEYLFSKFKNDNCNIRLINIIDLEDKFSECINSIDQLENWKNFLNLLDKLCNLGVKDFIDFAIDQKIQPHEFNNIFNKAFYNQWIEYIISNSDILTSFNRVSHDQVVERFCTKDKENFTINQIQIKTMILKKFPSMDVLVASSPVSILLSEERKKRKQKPIRKLFDEIGELVQTIKPCFLMSPLSVSTYLNPNSLEFDTIIFDEASQIFPEDALGAIYRGKQLIVCGDSKQMPPSNFFNSINADDEDDEEGLTDYESILDLCSGKLKKVRLKWHYRSKSGALIAFSNKNFYDNELIIFPSPDENRKDLGLKYYYVDGIFDHKAKTNEEEADKVIELIYEHISECPERSLGVVTFNIKQQELIENKLDKVRLENRKFESFFKEDKNEPFFIKNLENVQGDERDTIIFSIAYGKDSSGKLYQNFGPLSKDGGERRLNVAVSRAKYNIKVVSSMHYNDIDLTRTKQKGTKLLREYLDYAENGNIGLERTLTVDSADNFDSYFEKEVCDFLRSKGILVDSQVGCSSFKIDLAVKKPNSSNYVLAIECDGATYHSFKSARDRDRLRQEILENLGWKFYRIWSTSWFKDNRTEKDKLLKAVYNALNNDSNEIKKKNNENLKTIDDNFFIEKDDIPKFSFSNYIMVDIDQIIEKSNGYYSTMSILKSTLDIESPLSEEWFLKRICFLYDREKVTIEVRRRFNIDIQYCDRVGIVRKNGFIYLKNKEINDLRIPIDGFLCLENLNIFQKRNFQLVYIGYLKIMFLEIRIKSLKQ